MRLIAAVKEAEKDDRIQKIIKKKGFLCAAYVTLKPEQEIIESWELGYYDPEAKKITPVSVTDDFIKVGEADSPLEGKLHEELSSNVTIPSAEALKAGKLEAAKHKIPVQSIMLSLRKKDDALEWNVIFITKLMSILIVRIDAEDGKIKEAVLESLVSNVMHKQPGTAG